ncbi:hypothetical protein CE91St43_28020 [Oscillospiraceae bacterium]|nr:hypothetical protein CE91St43_28020 [Oscillospiraceae bacterium]
MSPSWPLPLAPHIHTVPSERRAAEVPAVVLAPEAVIWTIWDRYSRSPTLPPTRTSRGVAAYLSRPVS